MTSVPVTLTFKTLSADIAGVIDVLTFPGTLVNLEVKKMPAVLRAG